MATSIGTCLPTIAPLSPEVCDLVELGGATCGWDAHGTSGASLLHVGIVHSRKEHAHFAKGQRLADVAEAHVASSVTKSYAAVSSFTARLGSALHDARVSSTVLIFVVFTASLILIIVCVDNVRSSGSADRLSRASLTPDQQVWGTNRLCPHYPRHPGGISLRLVGQIQPRNPQNSMVEVEQACHRWRAELVFRVLFTEGTASAGVMVEDAASRSPLAILDTRAAIREGEIEGSRFVQIFLHASARPAAHLVVEANSLGHVVVFPVGAGLGSLVGNTTLAANGSRSELAAHLDSGSLHSVGAKGPPLCIVRFAKEGEHANIISPDSKLLASMHASAPGPVGSRPRVASLSIGEGLDEVFILCVLVAALKLG